MGGTADNKKPAQGGFFLSQRLTAQAVAFIAIVNACDNQRVLQCSDVCRCRAFCAVFDGEGDLLAFIQGFVAIALNSRKVYEYIFAAVIRRNKAKTFI